MITENKQHEMVPTLKLTANAEKITTPGKKQVWRIRSNDGKKPEGDLVTLAHERPDLEDELFMFHPQYTYINKTVRDFEARPLLIEIFDKGELVYDLPEIEEIRNYSYEQLSRQYEEHRRILNPEQYPVDLSQELYDLKMNTIEHFRGLTYGK